jgi:hypothetical protein
MCVYIYSIMVHLHDAGCIHNDLDARSLCLNIVSADVKLGFDMLYVECCICLRILLGARPVSRCCIELRERERGRGRREGGSREAGRQGECVYEGLAHGYHRIIVHVKPGDKEPERETHAAAEH